MLYIRFSPSGEIISHNGPLPYEKIYFHLFTLYRDIHSILNNRVYDELYALHFILYAFESNGQFNIINVIQNFLNKYAKLCERLQIFVSVEEIYDKIIIDL